MSSPASTETGQPGDALATASEHTALVVVGAGHRRSLNTVVLGSVSQHLLHEATCPVAVVP
ncbi:universal stress protein [Nocardioides panacisoli]|uniref:universal stress protein n=1 Tax=Nocardioides panacisoli TaxID=627624 RepID=UPI0031D04349